MTRYEKFMKLPKGVRVVISILLFIPSWAAAQPEILRELYGEWRGLVK